MRSIMPPGYSRHSRKQLEEQLRQKRAAELAKADKDERARIEKEIHAEVDKQLGKNKGKPSFLSRVLW